MYFRTLHAYLFKNKQSGNHIRKSKFKDKTNNCQNGTLFYRYSCSCCYYILLSYLRNSKLATMATKLQKLHDVREFQYIIINIAHIYRVNLNGCSNVST